MTGKYKAYPEYKDSGVEWLGKIPEHWKTGTLRWHIDIASGEGLSNNEFEKDQEEHLPYRVIGGNGTLGFTHRINTTKKAFAIGRVGALCGNVHFINETCWITDNALKLSAWRGFSDNYFEQLLTAARLNEYASKSAQPLITGEQVKALQVTIPPEDEQQAIEAFLYHETAKIDTLIEEQQSLIRLLQEKRQAVISHAVTKGLNPDASMKDSGVEWLGEVPEHWEIVPVKHLAKIRYGIGEPPKYKEAGIPLIRATNIRSGKVSDINLVLVDPADIPSQRIVWLKAGDIIVVRSGAGTGDSSIIPEKYAGSIAGFDMVVTPEKCVPSFLGHALLSNYIRDNQIDLEKTRAAQPHLNAEELGDCFVLVPPESEQISISNHVEVAADKFDLLADEAHQAIELMQERRTALISAAVTGKIDVREWSAPKSTSQQAPENVLDHSGTSAIHGGRQQTPETAV